MKSLLNSGRFDKLNRNIRTRSCEVQYKNILDFNFEREGW